MGNAILSLFIGFNILFFGSCAKKRMPQKPNIVFIMTDDMGYETLSYNGAVNYDTPNIDRLAGESYIFSVYFHPLNAYIRGKEYKYYLDGRLYNIKNDPRELHPYYSQSDDPGTVRFREKLKAQLAELLEEGQLSEHSIKDRLIKTFGDYRSEKENHWLLRSFIFDSLEYTPRSETLSFDLTKYLGKGEDSCSLRFSRSHLSGDNSGLTFADAKVRSVRVFQDGDTLLTKEPEDEELTTRRNVDMLRRRGNPIISFTREGDDSKISLGELALRNSEPVKVEADVALSNPANQWGDRIILHVYLDKHKNEKP